ncbi:recombinase family protein [Streptomyces albiflaviniger]|nr:recombinase family protein [Streptomyces albiflaviniger]
MGKPPYGYLAEKVPHPVPARRAEGCTKHRLVPDTARAPAVTYIFQLRGLDKLGYDAIADRLNLDPLAYPPPEPTRPDMALHRWSGSAVREILRNPKYTGYQVWNRRATTKGGCYNDPKDWVWSPQPTHEPLVSKSCSMWLPPWRGSAGGHGGRPVATPTRRPGVPMSCGRTSSVRSATAACSARTATGSRTTPARSTRTSIGTGPGSAATPRVCGSGKRP